MAPFRRATDLTFTRSDGDRKIYAGHIDSQWVVGAVPHGGYILALIIEACMKSQADTDQPDPIHVAAHYLKSASVAPYEIHVRALRRGRGFSNLTADLVQQGEIRIMAHLIFGSNVDTSAEKPHLTLLPTSRYARRIPMYSHPSAAVPSKLRDRDMWAFRPHINMCNEKAVLARNSPDNPKRSNSSTVGDGGMEWASWFGFVDKDDLITSPSMAFLADMFANLPTLLPPSEREGLGPSWFPTMYLAIEFKSPIPKKSKYHSDRAVALYSNCVFYNDGRHDSSVEIWTAPSDFGEGEDKGDWRDKQVCLAVATQLAYTVPFSVNLAKKDKARL